MSDEDLQESTVREEPIDDAKDEQINRMAGCARYGSCLLKISLLIIMALVLYFGLSKMGLIKTTSHRVKATLKELRVATEYFKVEYNTFPIPPIASEQDTDLRSRGVMLDALTSNEDQLNRRKIIFLHLPVAKDRKNGCYLENNEQVLVDPWGEPYYVTLDTSGDNKIADPENAGEFLANSVILYSAGPDRDPKTWKDNTRSWK